MSSSYKGFYRVIATVKHELGSEDEAKKVEQQVIDQLPKDTLPHQFYYVINNATRECVYVSKSAERLTGYAPEEFTYDLVLENIHPEDKSFIDRSLLTCFQYCNSGRKMRPVSDALTINYRFRHKEGHYIHILRNAYCSSLDKKRNMIHNTSMCMVITEFKSDNKQKMMLTEGSKLLMELSSDESNENWEKLSKREREIVELLCINKTSKEIADELCISKNTVDTHRRKILNKLKCENTMQLVLNYFMLKK